MKKVAFNKLLKTSLTVIFSTILSILALRFLKTDGFFNFIMFFLIYVFVGLLIEEIFKAFAKNKNKKYGNKP